MHLQRAADDPSYDFSSASPSSMVARSRFNIAFSIDRFGLRELRVLRALRVFPSAKPPSPSREGVDFDGRAVGDEIDLPVLVGAEYRGAGRLVAAKDCGCGVARKEVAAAGADQDRGRA